MFEYTQYITYTYNGQSVSYVHTTYVQCSAAPSSGRKLYVLLLFRALPVTLPSLSLNPSKLAVLWSYGY